MSDVLERVFLRSVLDHFKHKVCPFRVLGYHKVSNRIFGAFFWSIDSEHSQRSSSSEFLVAKFMPNVCHNLTQIETKSDKMN